MSDCIKIKVCGLLNNRELLNADISLPVDYLGLIFVKESPRCFEESTTVADTLADKVGVFVNAQFEEITAKINHYGLKAVQLHGDESPEMCQELRGHCTVFKVISIFTEKDFEQTKQYESAVDYFLFDTGGSKRGGNGTQFDWNWLKNYTGSQPFFVSGGIGPSDIERLRWLHHPQFSGIDLNSKFETKPGIKNFPMIKKFIHDFKK